MSRIDDLLDRPHLEPQLRLLILTATTTCRGARAEPRGLRGDPAAIGPLLRLPALRDGVRDAAGSLAGLTDRRNRRPERPLAGGGAAVLRRGLRASGSGCDRDAARAEPRVPRLRDRERLRPRPRTPWARSSDARAHRCRRARSTRTGATTDRARSGRTSFRGLPRGDPRSPLHRGRRPFRRQRVVGPHQRRTPTPRGRSDLSRTPLRHARLRRAGRRASRRAR